jgi:hypothetical protein
MPDATFSYPLTHLLSGGYRPHFSPASTLRHQLGPDLW